MRMLILVLSAAALALPAAAQEGPAEPGGAIVVQGTRIQDEEVGTFVDALTPAPVFGQLSRFAWSVCPAAVGLGEAQNGAVARRMAQVAAASSIPVAKPGCKPNVLLLVANDKAGLIDGMARKYPAYFDGVSNPEIRDMKRNPSAAVAWHVEGRMNPDNISLSKAQGSGYYVNERTDTPSRISTASRPNFLAAIVVVERRGLSGLTITQLADYAAMRAFAETDPRRLNKSAAPSILAAIDTPMGSPVPLTLTEWDLAFLKSLYGSNPNRTAASQRGEMKRIVQDELQGKPRRNRR